MASQNKLVSGPRYLGGAAREDLDLDLAWDWDWAWDWGWAWVWGWDSNPHWVRLPKEQADA